MLLAEELPLEPAEWRLPQCMRVFGADELLEAHPIARHMAAARVAHYTDGTTEMQNERIAAYLESRIDD